MSNIQIKVLLVEDNPGDARLVKEALSEASGQNFSLIHVGRLSEALVQLEAEEIDIVLLDLSLPDSQGIDSVVRAQREASEVPIIVLTGNWDEHLGVKCVQEGAQDYLVKGQIDSNLLVRSIRYAVERRQLLLEIEQSRQQEQREKEVQSLEQISTAKAGDAVTVLSATARLRDAQPHVFEQLVNRYEDLLDFALEQGKSERQYNIPDELASLGEKLGTLNVGPRDVVAIHTEAFKRKLREAKHQNVQAYLHEGRLMVIELMGNLASYYRDIAIGNRVAS